MDVSANEPIDRPAGDDEAAVARAAARLERLRALRRRPERPVEVGPIIERTRREARRSERRLGDVAQAWTEAVPPEVGEHCRLIEWRAGVLTVGVGSAARRYALDRLLRQGLATTLRATSQGRITSVRLRVDPKA